MPLEDGKQAVKPVTETDSAHLALQREAEKNRILLHNASDGIHILDIRGNIVEVSNAFCNMLGYRRDELLGMNVRQWDAAFDEVTVLNLVKQQFKKKCVPSLKLGIAVRTEP